MARRSTCDVCVEKAGDDTPAGMEACVRLVGPHAGRMHRATTKNQNSLMRSPLCETAYLRLDAPHKDR